jgi:hypothetical protein
VMWPLSIDLREVAYILWLLWGGHLKWPSKNYICYVAVVDWLL